MLPLIRNVYSMWMLDVQTSQHFLGQLQVALSSSSVDSWHSRLAAIQMLQNFGIFNLFVLNDELRATIRQLIVDSLVDEQLEVRLLVSLTLTGFIHSNLIQVDQQLIVRDEKIMYKSRYHLTEFSPYIWVLINFFTFSYSFSFFFFVTLLTLLFFLFFFLKESIQSVEQNQTEED